MDKSGTMKWRTGKRWCSVQRRRFGTKPTSVLLACVPKMVESSQRARDGKNHAHRWRLRGRLRPDLRPFGEGPMRFATNSKGAPRKLHDIRWHDAMHVVANESSKHQEDTGYTSMRCIELNMGVKSRNNQDHDPMIAYSRGSEFCDEITDEDVGPKVCCRSSTTTNVILLSCGRVRQGTVHACDRENRNWTCRHKGA